MSEGWRLVSIAIGVPLFMFVLVLGLVWLSGGMFGQRCAKAFPTDPARAELCVYNLSKGNAP